MPDENGPSTEHWIAEPVYDETAPEPFTEADFEDTTENVTKSAEATESTTESS